ncbi:MAG TPA: fluoride efflux transporter CrcB [Segetibacter sp.]
MIIKNLILVGLGGMTGSLLRYLLYVAFGNQSFPYATLIINIIGSFVIGIVTAVAIKNASFDSSWKLFLATGVCGGFTTFSAFSIETVLLLQQNRNIAAFLYVAGSVGFGFVAALLGYVTGR